MKIEEIEVAKADTYVIELVSEPGKQPILCVGREVLVKTLMDLAKNGVEKVMISAYVCSHSYSMSLPSYRSKEIIHPEFF